MRAGEISSVVGVLFGVPGIVFDTHEARGVKLKVSPRRTNCEAIDSVDNSYLIPNFSFRLFLNSSDATLSALA